MPPVTGASRGARQAAQSSGLASVEGVRNARKLRGLGPLPLAAASTRAHPAARGLPRPGGGVMGGAPEGLRLRSGAPFRTERRTKHLFQLVALGGGKQARRPSASVAESTHCSIDEVACSSSSAASLRVLPTLSGWLTSPV